MPFTSVISTSFFDDALPAAWKITRANEKILIPAGTPIITVIPISIGGLSDIELDLYDKDFTQERADYIAKRNEAWKEITQAGGFTNFYRDAVDYEGNSIGKHELKALRLKVNDYTEK